MGSFPANPSGLDELHGNVWAWCADRFTPCTDDEQTDPCANDEQSNELRVLRGGSWFDSPRGCRAALRFRNAPASRNRYYGFRVAFRLD